MCALVFHLSLSFSNKLYFTLIPNDNSGSCLCTPVQNIVSPNGNLYITCMSSAKSYKSYSDGENQKCRWAKVKLGMDLATSTRQKHI